MQDLAGHVRISAFVMRWVLLDGFQRKSERIGSIFERKLSAAMLRIG